MNRYNPFATILAILGALAALVTILSFFGISRWRQIWPADISQDIPITSTEALKAEVRSAIQTAAIVEARAFATLEGGALQEVYTGEILRNRQERIRSMRQKGIYKSETLLNRRYDEIQIGEGGGTATVRMNEQFNDQYFYSSSRRPQGEAKVVDVPQTAYLRKEGSRWMITNLDFHTR